MSPHDTLVPEAIAPPVFPGTGGPGSHALPRRRAAADGRTAGFRPAATTAPAGRTVPPVDTLLRCFLYMAQHLRYPVAAADLDALAPPAAPGMDEQRFCQACARQGFRASRSAAKVSRLAQLPAPFVLVGKPGQASRVVVGRHADDGALAVLDVVDASIRRMTPEAASALSSRAIVVYAPRPSRMSGWREELAKRVRAVLGELLVASLAINILALATPLFMMAVFNRVIGHGSPESLRATMVVLAIGMAIAYLFDLALRILRGLVSSHTGVRIDTLMSGAIMRHLVHLPYRHFESTPSGVIAERLRQLDTLRTFFTGQMPTLIIDVGFAALFLGVLFLVSVPLGVLVLLMLPLFAGVSLLTHRKQRRHIDVSFHAQAAKNSALNETVNNAGTIKALGLETEMEQRWAARVAESAAAGFRAANLANVVASTTFVLQLFAGLGVVLLGVWELAEQRLSIGGLIAATLLAGRTLAPMRQAASVWHTVQAVRAAFARIDDMMRIPSEWQPQDRPPLPPIAGAVALERIAFRYSEEAPPVVQDIDLRIEAGSIVGIIGPSGSGKTTIANLIQGLLRPASGRVTIDGTDIAHLSPADMRAQVGSVPQEAQLFAGTVRENIAMGVADKAPARVVAAARLVGAHAFIQRLPQGYDTVLGERGIGLSAGQRQLVCLARALMREPRLVVLDEATSALDPATEEQFLRALRTSLRGRTVIMITHRMAPLAIADNVALVLGGRIERFGPPTEVMAYARIRMAEASRRQRPTAAPAGEAGSTAAAGTP